MRTILLVGVMAMGLFSGCKTFYHKLITGDHDSGQRYVEITAEKIAQIEPGITTAKDLDRIFEKRESNKWTYTKPFWITWEGKRYAIDMSLGYRDIKYADPIAGEHFSIYSWKEQRSIQVYLYKGIVRLFLVSHLIRNERREPITGPLDNYDIKLRDLDQMSGLGCDRRIYDVVSLGRKDYDPEEFDKYCRPLIIEKPEK